MGEPTAGTEGDDPLLIRAERARALAVSRPVEGAERAHEVAAEAAAAQDWRALAVAASGEAWARRELYQHEEAARAADAALRAARRSGRPEEESRALMTRATIRLVAGSVTGARRDLDAAAAVAARLGPELAGLDAELRFSSSVVLELAGRPEESRQLLESVLDLPACDAEVRAKALINLAVLTTEEDPARAQVWLEEAVALLDGSEFLGVVATHNLGRARALGGDVPGALATFEAVEAELRRLDGPVAEHHLDVAEVLGELRLLPESRAAVDRALADLAGEGGALVRADALLVASRLARADRDLDAAARHADAATELFVHQERPLGVALAGVERALVHLDAGEPAEAAEGLGRAIAAFEQLAIRRQRADAHLTAGRAARAAGRAQDAITHWTDPVLAAPECDPLTAALAAAEAATLRGDPGRVLRATAPARRSLDRRASLAVAPDLRHRLLWPRVEIEQLERVARAGQRPGRQLDAILRTRPPAPPPARGSGRRDAEDAAQWRRLQRRLADPEEPPEVLAAVQRQLRQVERRLRSGRWGHAAGGDAEAPEGLADLRRLLDGRPAVALVRIGDDAVAFRVSTERVRRRVLGPWRELAASGLRLQRAVGRLAGRAGAQGPAGGGRPGAGAGGAARAALLAAAGELDRLVAPLLAPEPSEVLLVVDRGLEAVPWSAVASLWAVPFTVVPLAAPAPRRGRGGPAGPAAGDGQRAVYLGAGPGLAFARAEVDRLGEVWRDVPGPPGSPVVERAVRASTFVERVAGCDVAHVAAHAELRSDNALLSPIHMDDAPLTIGELVDADRLPDVLYLSCCSLAGGRGGDTAALGAVAALLQAGAGEVVASTARLPDADATDIAVAVHGALAGGRPAAAGLAEARSVHDRPTTGALAALAGLAAYSAIP
jgi:tetratricopeptide (TPR) repeat protein